MGKWPSSIAAMGLILCLKLFLLTSAALPLSLLSSSSFSVIEHGSVQASSRFSHCTTGDSNMRAHVSNEDSDRISNLPDEILHHILSHLETKEAMQKSLLSKRWVSICSSLPCINLMPTNDVRLKSKGYFYQQKMFKEYVQTVLHHRRGPFLHTFRIHFPLILEKPIRNDLVQTCVNYAMERNCRVFSLEVSLLSEKLCSCIFASKSLEEMCLQTSFGFPYVREVIPNIVDLPRIRRLHLKNSKVDSGSISRLLSGCPVLEQLTLENCFGEFLCVFNQKLRYLHLLNCTLKLPQCERTFHVKSCIQQDTVESSIWFGMSRVEFIWKTSSVSAADIDPFSFMHNFFCHLDLDHHLRDLSAVTILKLRRQDFLMLEKELKVLGEFQNLKELCLSGWCMTCNFNPVALFIQRSPNLQRLTLQNFEGPCQRESMRINHTVDISAIHTESWRNHIKAHKLKETVLPRRHKGIKDVVLSQFGKSSFRA